MPVNIGDVVVGLIVAAIIVAAIVKLVKDKGKGKCAGCNCCDGSLPLKEKAKN